ncbi:MAG: hypothetical protein KGD63_02495 [Candidatus Lokiarchaeota archaeon]|nr:hypothetical protein [Candidatus Lokiarchaeota archaeon]
MLKHSIKIEAIEINTDSGICPGMAKTKNGEINILGARTPNGDGICSSALTAIQPWGHSMMLTDKMDWEQNDYFDVTCLHGYVKFRLSRINEK